MEGQFLIEIQFSVEVQFWAEHHFQPMISLEVSPVFVGSPVLHVGGSTVLTQAGKVKFWVEIQFLAEAQCPVEDNFWAEVQF